MPASDRYAELRNEGFNVRQERAQVAKGARLLDKILPGWHERVNLDKLHMASGAQCMMGQLFGENVETALAKEMYPDEFEAAFAGRNNCGFFNALVSDSGSNGSYLGGMVLFIMEEVGLDKDPEAREELDALIHVCAGHDTKCLWAEEVAARKVEDAH